MPSVVIHMCVASEVNKRIKVKNYNEYLLGAIAPDLAKVIGLERKQSHFIDLKINNHPNPSKFYEKYGIDNDFFLGYYVHLLTDFIWEKDFIGTFKYKDIIKLKDGTKLNYDLDTYKKYLYNDYTNLNIKLLDEYNLDLSLFSNEVVLPKIYMDEIPIERLPELLDATSVIIENSKEGKEYFFDIDSIKEFIESAVNLIVDKILTWQRKFVW